MCYNRIYYILTLSVFTLINGPVFAQVELDSSQLELKRLIDTSEFMAMDTLPMDSLSIDSLGLVFDSTAIISDTLLTDKISDDALDEPVSYGARDTQWYDHVHKKMHLFGEAYVNYQQMELKAGYIIYDLESSTAEAYAIKDDAGHTVQKPSFKDGDQSFTYEQLKYNFKSKKGLVQQAVTQEGDLYVLGATTKFIGKSDSIGREDDVIYNTNALVTSCDHDHPHYGIRTKRLKVIPQKVGVTGPAQLEIAGVPTPLWLPFGFFPLADGRSTGLIFPSDFPYEGDRGFGIRGIGWYFPISDYVDLKITGDFWTRGSWLANMGMNYKKRYRYNGSVNISYADNKFEDFSDGSIQSSRSFGIRLTHNQDAKAHPYRTIGGSINFSSNGFNNRNYSDPRNVLTNRYTSNFRFKHSMPNTPFNFSMGLSHEQNTQTNAVRITLPEVDLRMNTIYPFRRKNKVTTQEKWYELISLQYTSRAANYIETVDTALFRPEVFENMKYGVRQTASTGASFQLFKYITINPNASYEEHWIFRTVEKQYFEAEDSIASMTVGGFKPYRKFNSSITANTQLFGILPVNKGPVKAFRHTLKPSITANYNPDTKMLYEEILTNSRGEEVANYTPFEGGPFGSPRGEIERASLRYGLGNVIEMKYLRRKDSTEQKIRLLESFNISGDYNFAKDTVQWSPVAISSNTRIFKRYTKLSLSATLDPYLENGSTRVNQFVRDDTGRLLRMDFWRAQVSTDFTIKQLVDLVSGPKDDDKTKSDTEDSDSFTPLDPKLIEILSNIRISHKLSYTMSTQDNTEMSIMRQHTLGLAGNIKLTENWNLSVSNLSYDFIDKDFIYPFFTFSRQLHCWKMNFSWAPNRDAYSFFIGVNSSTLDFLKYNYGQNNVGIRGLP